MNELFTTIFLFLTLNISSAYAEEDKSTQKIGYSVTKAEKFNFQAHGFEVRRVPTCPEKDYSMLVIDGVLKAYETIIDDNITCGNIYFF